MDNKGLGDARKAWVLLQQKFRSDETLTVLSVMRQLARLQLKEDEALHSFFIRAKDMSTTLEHAGEELSKPLLNAMMLNGFTERYEHFVVQENFNSAGSFVEFRTRRMNCEECRIHWEFVDKVDSHVAMTSRKAKPKHKSQCKYNAPPQSSSG